MKPLFLCFVEKGYKSFKDRYESKGNDDYLTKTIDSTQTFSQLSLVDVFLIV